MVCISIHFGIFSFSRGKFFAGLLTVYLNRRSILTSALAGIAVGNFPAYAQQSSSLPVRRIGFLIGDYPPFIDAFMGELARLGYQNGKNLLVEMRISRLNSNDLEGQAAELANLDLELIVAAALPQALAVRRYNSGMPMVVGTAPGLVSNGFARSLKSPGGNVTGMDELPPMLTARRLKILKAAVPTLSRVAVLSTTPGTGGHEMQLADAQTWATQETVEVKSYRATNLKMLEEALRSIKMDEMEGLVSFQGALALSNAKMISAFAAEARLPAIYQSKLFVDAGGLMAYAPDQEEQFRNAARYVDRILRGTPAGNLPITHPSRYYLTYNEKAAIQIGLRPSRAFTRQIDNFVSASS